MTADNVTPIRRIRGQIDHPSAPTRGKDGHDHHGPAPCPVCGGLKPDMAPPPVRKLTVVRPLRDTLAHHPESA